MVGIPLEQMIGNAGEIGGPSKDNVLQSRTVSRRESDQAQFTDFTHRRQTCWLEQ
jgi:hypothetical protein